MRNVYLYGDLAEKYGSHFELEVDSPAEAVHALSVQLPGFRRDFAERDWHVMRGDKDKPENSLSEEHIHFGLGDKDLHLVPAIEGSKGGLFSTVAGAVLTVVGVMTGNPYLTYAGVAMMTYGATQMMAVTPQQPNYAENEDPSEQPSFLFKGAVNTSTQGIPVPLVYGKVRVGSVVISAGMSSEDIPVVE